MTCGNYYIDKANETLCADCGHSRILHHNYSGSCRSDAEFPALKERLNQTMCMCTSFRKPPAISIDSIDPPHYKDLKPEPIEVMEAWGFDKDYYKATALKYLSRAGRKGDEIEDLEKCIWFLKRKIESLKKQQA